MSNDDKVSISIGSAIPQLFFDIIARLVPGSIVIGSLVLSHLGPDQAKRSVDDWLKGPSENHPSIILILVSGFSLSYGISIIFLGLWFLGESFIKNRRDKKDSRKSKDDQTKEPAAKAASDAEGSAAKTIPMEEISEDEYSIKYDFIKFRNPAAGNRIAKLHAEVHMARVFIIGFCLSLGIDIYRLIIDRPLEPSRFWLLLLFLAAAIGSIGARGHFELMRRRAVRNYAKMLKYRKEKSENAEQ